MFGWKSASGIVMSCLLAACTAENVSGSETSSADVTGAKTEVTQVPPKYPAFTPDVPQLVATGRVLAAPRFQLVRYDADALGPVADKLVAAIGASAYWSATTAEYGVGPATALAPLRVTDAPPDTLDDTEIQSFLRKRIAASPPSGDFGYVLVVPHATALTRAGKDLCAEGIGGYHSMLTLAGGATVPYAVAHPCDGFLGLTGEDELTFEMSHEMIEMVTNPDGATGWATRLKDIGWAALEGGRQEAADLCALGQNALRVPELGAIVQRSWSNAAALAGHEPCVPAANEIAFGAQAVLPDVLASYGAPVLDLAVGESKTIDVQLWSEAPTDDFTVECVDGATVVAKKSPELGCAFEGGAKSFTGHNGDVAKLTVTALHAGSLDATVPASFFVIAALSKDKKRFRLAPAVVVQQ